MAGKRGCGRFLGSGHPGVVILRFLVRGLVLRSGEFKGPWMGVSGPGVKGALFLGSQKPVPVLPKGPGWGFRAGPSRDGKVLIFVIFRVPTVKIGTYSQWIDP